MTQSADHPVLQKPIHSLNVSPEFRAMARANGYKTLEDIIKAPLHDLPEKKKSGYRVLKELLDLLEQFGLSQLINDDE